MAGKPVIKRTRRQVEERRSKRKKHGADNRRISAAAGTLPVGACPYSLKQLDKILNATVKEFVELRAKYRWGDGLCEICRTRWANQPFHWITRAEKGIKWHPDNLCFSCSGCNMNERMTRGQVTYRYKAIFVARFGDARWKRLEQIALAKRKWSRDEMWDLLKRIRRALRGEADPDYVLVERPKQITGGRIADGHKDAKHAAEGEPETEAERGDRRHPETGVPGTPEEVLRREPGPDAPVLRGDAGPGEQGAPPGPVRGGGEAVSEEQGDGG